MKGIVFYAAYSLILMTVMAFLSNKWGKSDGYELPLPPPPPVTQIQD